MAEKQVPLNGAYYGPSVPPGRNYHRPGRGSFGGGCCCCLLSLICKIILAVVITVCLAALIFWLIVRPKEIKFHVTDVAVDEFNLQDNSSLQFNMSAKISVRNPNKKIGIYYDTIEARGYYVGKRFSTDYLTPFYQGHKNTSFLSANFQGQQLVMLDKSEYEQDKTAGIYDIDFKLYLNLRFKIGSSIKLGKFKPKIKCDLKVPFGGAGQTQTTAYKSTKCKWDFR
ncbi:hypothetical protein ACFE04_021438 [Oxalis oulophora]